MEKPSSKREVPDAEPKLDSQTEHSEAAAIPKRKLGRKKLRIALARLSTIQAVGIAVAIAIMCVGTAYFVLVKPVEPEPVVAIVVPETKPVVEVPKPAPVKVIPKPAPVQVEKPKPVPSTPLDPRICWVYATGDQPDPGRRSRYSLITPPVVDGGLVYATRLDTLYTLSTGGEEVREFSTPDKTKFNEAVIGTDSSVLVSNRDGVWWSIDNRGKLNWVRHMNEAVVTPPAVRPNGDLIIGSNKLHYIDSTGKKCWKFEAEDGSFHYSHPVLGENIIANCSNGWLFAVSYAGELVWKVDLGASPNAKSIIDNNGFIYTSSRLNSKVYYISPSGELIWSTKLQTFGDANLGILPDNSLVAVLDGLVVQLTSDGKVQWQVRADVAGHFPMFVSSSGLIFLSCTYSMLVLNPGGSEACEVDMPSGRPMGFSEGPDGEFYVTTYHGEVLRVELEE